MKVSGRDRNVKVKMLVVCEVIVRLYPIEIMFEL